MDVVLHFLIFRCYVIDCKTNTPNIPYADSFYTQTRYCITWAGPEQARISKCLGITWLKNPFVKSIIKSATYRAFDDTCSDYMICLRQEIAAKIGASAASGESASSPRIEKELVQDNESTKYSDSDLKDQNKSRGENWVAWIFDNISENKMSLLALIFAFLLGAFIGRIQFGRKIGRVLSSYDLELEVLRDLNVSKVPLSPSQTTWSSPKFQQTHSQLTRLHEDFSTVRKSIWYTLQRVNELERRVYKAEMAALLGDRLLSCYDQKDSPSCTILQEQWKSLLKDKQNNPNN